MANDIGLAQCFKKKVDKSYKAKRKSAFKKKQSK